MDMSDACVLAPVRLVVALVADATQAAVAWWLAKAGASAGVALTVGV